MNQELIARLVDMEGEVVPILFKPVQFNIIKKLETGKKLTDNEKRYLRGKMGKKLQVIEEIASKERETYGVFLNSLRSYYITGLEALKHNGYGWYFDTKIIEVINTNIEGRLRIGNKTFKLIRAKSLRKSDYKRDKNTGLMYATNDQVFKDTNQTKNDYTKSVWKQMLSRYGKLFLGRMAQLRKATPIDYSRYGV